MFFLKRIISREDAAAIIKDSVDQDRRDIEREINEYQEYHGRDKYSPMSLFGVGIIISSMREKSRKNENS